MEINNVERVLAEYTATMVAEMITVLKQRDSKNLVNDFDPTIVKDINSITAVVELPGYAYYASEGRNPGKFPPLKPIEEWCDNRNIPLSAAFPIAQKIATLGSKMNASHFLEKWRLSKDFEGEILDAYMKDVEIALQEYVNKLNNE